MKAISLRFTPEQAKYLTILKERYGLSFNQVVRFAVAYLQEHRAKIESVYPYLQEKKDEKERSRQGR